MNEISSFLGFPNGKCQHCKKIVEIKRKYIYDINCDEIEPRSNEVTIKDILIYLVRSTGNRSCCSMSNELNKEGQKYLVFEFSKPMNLNISSSESVWGRSLNYMSHIEEYDLNSY